MMSKIITAAMLALAMALANSAALAVAGDKGFYYGTEVEQHDLNNVLARLVRASLDKDPSGNARLSESNCKERGGCGTPRLMADSFRQMKGLPPVDLSNLAEFLESLEADENRGGYYDVTSLRPDSTALGGFRAVMDGVQRGFNLGEKAWVYHDKKNNRKIVVLMGHCANPVYRLIPITIIGGTPSPPNTPAYGCPDGWTLKADAFSRKTLPPELLKKVDQAIAAAKARESQGGTVLEPYFTDAVSRTLGRELHEKVALTDVDADIVIRYIDTNSNGQLVTQNIGVLKMRHGTGIFRFTDDPRQHVSVGTGWPSLFLSPTVSGSEKIEGGLEPKLRIRRDEWRQCNLRMSGITP